MQMLGKNDQKPDQDEKKTYIVLQKEILKVQHRVFCLVTLNRIDFTASRGLRST